MKKIPFSALILFCAFFVSSANAKTILISDIDDTLKIAHVGDPLDMARRALRTDLHFSGMSELFRELARSGELEFFYVSNAQAKLMKNKHKKFLQEWSFPPGELYLNEGMIGQSHKEKTISLILENKKPDLVIFVGDNSEKDVQVYNNIVNKFALARVYQFIRMPYTSSKRKKFAPLQPGQTGFITPVEIMLTLKNGGDVDRVVASDFIEKIQAEVVSAGDVGMGPGYFPDWMDCRDFRWEDFSYDPALIQYNQKISQRCELN